MLLILCGIPCSGKTQLALALARRLEVDHGLHTIVVDPDRIRQMMPALADDFDPKLESYVESLALSMIDESLQHFNVVISDDLNYYESARHRLVQIARKHRLKYAIIHLTVSIDVAQKRNASREVPIPQELIQKVAEKFDYPGAKYEWDRPSLVLDSEKVELNAATEQSLDMILDKINQESKKTRVEGENSSLGSARMRIRRRSSKEILDKSTRKILNELLSSGELDRNRSKEANKLRRAFVDEAARKPMNKQKALNDFKRRVKEELT